MHCRKYSLLAISFFLLSTVVWAQDSKEKKMEDQIKQYWFVMLLKGPNRDQDSDYRGKNTARTYGQYKQVI